LPVVPLPLLPGDADMALDLQDAVNGIYDSFGYQFIIDYSNDPKPRLTPAQAKWSAEWLRRRGASGTPDAI
jgi:hypothetical protein